MKVIPIVHGVEDVPALDERPVAAPVPAFESLTVMLTELCNLDCWMCDFAVSKGLREQLPWGSEDFRRFISHPFFDRLHSIGFTGGEPFAHSDVRALYERLVQARPKLFFSFSSNANLLKPMVDTLAHTRDWSRFKLLTSIDGVETHDVQRGRSGALRKSLDNIDTLRRRYPTRLKFSRSSEIRYAMNSAIHLTLAAREAMRKRAMAAKPWIAP